MRSVSDIIEDIRVTLRESHSRTVDLSRDDADALVSYFDDIDNAGEAFFKRSRK